ncbi:MAG: Crp/Fnr family transcriptional regulator [Pseudomonadota bacterium]
MDCSSFSTLAETTLGGVWLLNGVPEDTLLQLGALADWQRLPVGTRLLASDTATRRLFFLTQGTVRLRVSGRAGWRDYGPGATVGLLTSFTKTPHGVDAQALTPVTVGWLDRDDLADMMARCPELAMAVARGLATRMQEPLPVQEERRMLDARVARALIVAGARYLRADGIAPLPSRPDPGLWAVLLGVEEADVRRSFARLERSGLIRTVAGERLHVKVAELKARLAR